MTLPRLEVLIACYGREGIERLARGEHPRIEGVEYTVCWQLPDGDCEVPPPLAGRDDFRIFKSEGRGLSRNRNHALEVARGEVVLIGDDDISYSPEGLRGVVEAFDRNPDYDVITFGYDSDCDSKRFADREFDWLQAPKGSYVVSFEIAFRREKVQGRYGFNEHFGVNGDFCAGEEDLFLNDMMRDGLRAKYVPLSICFHPGATTSGRVDPGLLVETKGAVFLHNHPRDWLLRMLVHAWRDGRPVWYCRQWMRGVRKARRLRVFKGR